jgi:hypothetical protein
LLISSYYPLYPRFFYIQQKMGEPKLPHLQVLAKIKAIKL